MEPANAIRALDMAGLKLAPGDKLLLKAEFEDEHGMFDYGRFLLMFNDTKPAGYYERAPAAAAAGEGTEHASAFSVSPLDGGSAGYFVPLTPAEAAAVAELQERLRHTVRTRGIVVKQFLKDYDPPHRGVVTKTRFLREMPPCLPFLAASDLNLLAKAYLTADGADVRYMVFHNDVTPSAYLRYCYFGGAHHTTNRTTNSFIRPTPPHPTQLQATRRPRRASGA